MKRVHMGESSAVGRARGGSISPRPERVRAEGCRNVERAAWRWLDQPTATLRRRQRNEQPGLCHLSFSALLMCFPLAKPIEQP